MKRSLALLFLLFPMCLFAQKVSLLTVDQLQKRMTKGKDTVYVVNFWATWCAPCIKELPYFERFSKEHKLKPVKVLLVSLDLKSKYETGVKPFVKRMKLQSEVFLLNEKDQQAYIDKIEPSWSGAIPATLVYNAKTKKRKFLEKELSYPELLTLYKSIK